MAEGVLIGVISMITVVCIYFWVVKRSNDEAKPAQPAQK